MVPPPSLLPSHSVPTYYKAIAMPPKTRQAHPWATGRLANRDRRVVLRALRSLLRGAGICEIEGNFRPLASPDSDCLGHRLAWLLALSLEGVLIFLARSQ